MPAVSSAGWKAPPAGRWRARRATRHCAVLHQSGSHEASVDGYPHGLPLRDRIDGRDEIYSPTSSSPS